MIKHKYNFKNEATKLQKICFAITLATLFIFLLIDMVIENASDLFYIIQLILIFVILMTNLIIILKENIKVNKTKTDKYNQILNNVFNTYNQKQEFYLNEKNIFDNKDDYIMHQLFSAIVNDDIYDFYINVCMFTKQEVIESINKHSISKDLYYFINTLFLKDKTYETLLKFRPEITELYKIHNNIEKRKITNKSYFYGATKY